MQRLETLNRFSPYALAILRIVVGLIFMPHGMQKLFGFPEPPQSGLPPAFSLFWDWVDFKFGGGLLMLLGLFTRPVAFLLSGEMAVAYWMVHAPQNFVPALNGGDAAILFLLRVSPVRVHRAGSVEPGWPDRGRSSRRQGVVSLATVRTLDHRQFESLLARALNGHVVAGIGVAHHPCCGSLVSTVDLRRGGPAVATMTIPACWEKPMPTPPP